MTHAVILESTIACPECGYRQLEEMPLMCGRPASADVGCLEGNTRIFAIIRGEHMMVPGPNTALEAGDRLLLVTAASDMDWLKQHMDKW